MTSGLPDLKPAVRVQFANHLSHLHDHTTVGSPSVLDQVPVGTCPSSLVEALSVLVLTHYLHQAIVDDRSQGHEQEVPTEVGPLAQQVVAAGVVRRPKQFAQSDQPDREWLVSYSDQ